MRFTTLTLYLTKLSSTLSVQVPLSPPLQIPQVPGEFLINRRVACSSRFVILNHLLQSSNNPSFRPSSITINHHVEAFHWVTIVATRVSSSELIHINSGLAWHTDDVALRSKFEEFGVVEEAVRPARIQIYRNFTNTNTKFPGCCQGS